MCSIVCSACSVERYNFSFNHSLFVNSHHDVSSVCAFCIDGYLADNDIVPCDYCGEHYPSDDLTEVNEQRVCPHCIDNHFSTCSSCDDIIENDDAVEVYVDAHESHYRRHSSESYCERCAERHSFNCDSCGDRHHDDNHIAVSGGGHICQSCLCNGDGYFSCDDCGEVCSDDDLGSFGDFGQHCTSCSNSRARNNASIPAYGREAWKELKHHGQQSQWLGIEIEIESDDRDDIIEAISADYNRSFCFERDGSLDSDTGLEIQSARMPLDRLRDKLTKLWTILDNLDHTDNAGTHVSIDRSTLKAYEIGKIHSFVNNSKHINFIDMIANRSQNGYCARRLRMFESRTYRSSAVNLTDKSRVELRLFAQCLTLDDAISYAEFADSLRAWVRSGVSWSMLTPENYHGYLASNKDKWPVILAKISKYFDDIAKLKDTPSRLF